MNEHGLIMGLSFTLCVFVCLCVSMCFFYVLDYSFRERRGEGLGLRFSALNINWPGWFHRLDDHPATISLKKEISPNSESFSAPLL